MRWRSLRRGELDHEAIWLAVSLAAGALGIAWLLLGLPLPQCTFRAWTGCPCPACGSTRAVARLVRGDPAAAWLLNPLAISAMAGVLAFDLYAAVVLALRLPRLRLEPVSPRVGKWTRIAIGVVLAGNWAWVIWSGV